MAVVEHAAFRAAVRHRPGYRVNVGVWLFCVVTMALAMWTAFFFAVVGVGSFAV
jgi:hypothetical protein